MSEYLNAPLFSDSLSLDGGWEVFPAGNPAEAVEATVPGCIHLDLLHAGRIADPFVEDKEIAAEWVSRTAWTWRRRFSVGRELLARKRVFLECDGLDTFAEVLVNGESAGTANNMFRSWRFDVKELLCEGENEIEVRFEAILEVAERLNAERSMHMVGMGPGGDKFSGGAWCRKAQCHFGWDWGPKLPTSGIWRGLRLRADDGFALGNVSIRQRHGGGGRVTLDVAAEVAGDFAGRRLMVDAVLLDGEEIVASAGGLADAGARFSLNVENPRLWWPNGLGAQPLYRLVVLLREGDVVYTKKEKRVGLRTLRLVREPDQWGESFRFEVNGHPFFAKGANWIPADSFLPRVSRADYARLLGDAAFANMNMLRVWGGGIYEDDAFYDLCDELGLCVWQDFMFACAVYPVRDHDWLENVRLEAEENIARLRHHACIALWCGNNELEQGLVDATGSATTMSWDDYRPLFDELLAEAAGRLDPDRSYWPSSPHTPHGDRMDFNNASCGDTHYWAVWHGKEPFTWYRTVAPRFCSEFGFQSFPEPRTVEGYAPPEERNITSYIMEHHQRSGIGNATMIHYMLSWFRMPPGFDATVWLSQIIQALAMKYAVEHWRRQMPRTMGAIYWQLNDCWPVASWSSIDYHGRWKALQYHARRFYAPLLLSIVEDKAAKAMAIHIASSLRDPRRATVRWFVYTTSGSLVREGQCDVSIQPARSFSLASIDLSAEAEAHGERNLVFFAELESGGGIVSRNSASWVHHKHLTMQEPNLKVTKDGQSVTISAARPAFQAHAVATVGEAVFSDNFIDLRPGEERRLELVRWEGTPAAILDSVKIASLYDYGWG